MQNVQNGKSSSKLVSQPQTTVKQNRQRCCPSACDCMRECMRLRPPIKYIAFHFGGKARCLILPVRGCRCLVAVWRFLLLHWFLHSFFFLFIFRLFLFHFAGFFSLAIAIDNPTQLAGIRMAYKFDKINLLPTRNEFACKRTYNIS